MQCPQCQQENPPQAKFCLECGQPVEARSAAPSRCIAPETYTPKHLAEKILTARSDLEGERKQVTVLFADIKGSTELIEGLDPEAARKLLDPALYVMMEAVHRYEGTVNQVLGDGIMALFGAPRGGARAGGGGGQRKYPQGHAVCLPVCTAQPGLSSGGTLR